MAQRTTVTIAFCDLVGSTALLNQIGEAANDELRRDVFSALRRPVELLGGTEVKTQGDGMMVAPVIYLDPNMMSGVLLYAFAAALMGGIDSPGGAVAGGFIVGVVENVMGAFVIGTELKLTVALLVIIVVLLVKPSGLFGRVFVTRV